MLMKKIALFSFSVAALLIAGCNEKPTPTPGTDDNSGNNGGEQPEKPADVVFAATLTEAGETDAIIALSHDGTNDDTYYGFYTSDLTASVEDAVNNKVDELKSTVSDLASVLFKGKTRNAVLGGLEAETDYRYIVFGLKEDGTVYGTAGSCDFTTAESTALKYTVNPAWTIAYGGKEVYQSMLVEIISVTSTSSERFATAVWTASVVDEYGIQAVIEQSLSDLTSEEGWIDYTYTESVNEMYMTFEDGVEKIAIVYGLTEDGQPTGKYAQSEKFLPEVIETSPEYAQWLGNWVLTDKAELSLPVSISYGAEPGKSYAVKGLQGFSDVVDGVLNEDGTFSLMTTDCGRYEHQKYGPVNTWYLGKYYNETAGKEFFITGQYPIFTASVLDGDTAAAVGETITLSDNSTVELVGMAFAGILLSEQYEGSVLTYANPNVKLPCLMTKAAAASGAKKASVSKNNKFTSISATTNQLMKLTAVAK